MFKKLSKQKRQHLILVALLTAVALGGLGFGLIRFQYANLHSIRMQHQEATAQLERMKETISRAERSDAELEEVSKALGVLEAEMATGDPYSWALDLVRRFRLSYDVDVPGISQPIVGDSTLLPNFPYRQASFSLAGSGYYHDIGRFITDFENQFPEIRIVNLSLTPLSGVMKEDREKLEFRMDIVALMRPNQS